MSADSAEVNTPSKMLYMRGMPLGISEKGWVILWRVDRQGGRAIRQNSALRNERENLALLSSGGARLRLHRPNLK